MINRGRDTSMAGDFAFKLSDLSAWPRRHETSAGVAGGRSAVRMGEIV
jgi:hypothetical protein